MGAGIFGKLPTAGDFVARGLGAGVRGALDSWLTAHLAAIAQAAEGWPEGGLRMVLRLADTDCLLLVEPSADAVGRSYPLCALVPLNGADRTAADGWADAVWPVLLRGVDGAAGAEALIAGLADFPQPGPGPERMSAPLIWWPGVAPAPPETALPRLAQISSG